MKQKTQYFLNAMSLQLNNYVYHLLHHENSKAYSVDKKNTRLASSRNMQSLKSSLLNFRHVFEKISICKDINTAFYWKRVRNFSHSENLKLGHEWSSAMVDSNLFSRLSVIKIERFYFWRPQKTRDVWVKTLIKSAFSAHLKYLHEVPIYV